MKYIICLTSNKFSKDGSILGKVADFQHELQKHEKEGLNIYKKGSPYYNINTGQKEKAPDQIYGLSSGVVFQAVTPSGPFLCICGFHETPSERAQKSEF